MDAPGNRAQAVVAYRVPGSGSVGIRFTVDTPGTADWLDTMIEVRTGACDDASMSRCYDDIDDPGGNYLSGGGISAMGGSTIYFVLTGFPSDEAGANEGAMQLDITRTTNAPPTLASATAQPAPGRRPAPSCRAMGSSRAAAA